MPLLNNKVANDENIGLSKPVEEVKALVDALGKVRAATWVALHGSMVFFHGSRVQINRALL